MSNLRTAALAAATAAALTLGTVPAAQAQTDPATVREQPSTSSKVGGALEAYGEDGKPTGADGRAFFGSSEGPHGIESQPAWAKLLYATTIITTITAFVSMMAAPVYNFLVHNGIQI